MMYHLQTLLSSNMKCGEHPHKVVLKIKGANTGSRCNQPTLEFLTWNSLRNDIQSKDILTLPQELVTLRNRKWNLSVLSVWNPTVMHYSVYLGPQETVPITIKPQELTHSHLGWVFASVFPLFLPFCHWKFFLPGSTHTYEWIWDRLRRRWNCKRSSNRSWQRWQVWGSRDCWARGPGFSPCRLQWQVLPLHPAH